MGSCDECTFFVTLVAVDSLVCVALSFVCVSVVDVRMACDCFGFGVTDPVSVALVVVDSTAVSVSVALVDVDVTFLWW